MPLRFRLPPYRAPRNHWRRDVHAAALAAMRRRGIRFAPGDRLSVAVRLYFPEQELRWHDVDNRLKDVLDALQGRAGGPKSLRALDPLIPNDRQVFRVVVEKSAPPGQSHGKGHVEVKVLRRR